MSMKPRRSFPMMRTSAGFVGPPAAVPAEGRRAKCRCHEGLLSRKDLQCKVVADKGAGGVRRIRSVLLEADQGVEGIAVCTAFALPCRVQDIEISELQAYRADYMKFRAGQALPGWCFRLPSRFLGILAGTIETLFACSCLHFANWACAMPAKSPSIKTQ